MLKKDLIIEIERLKDLLSQSEITTSYWNDENERTLKELEKIQIRNAQLKKPHIIGIHSTGWIIAFCIFGFMVSLILGSVATCH